MWINGVSVAYSTTDTFAFNTAATYIGSNNTSNAGFVNGYLSGMRILKGQALYDPTSSADIPVPTAPLTAIANTSFLLGFSEYQFIDQSPNNFTIARNGNTTQSTFGPYSANWSNYFDGTGDYLTAPDNAAFAFGTGDFTVEYWLYPVSFSNGPTIVDTRQNTTSTGGFSDYFGTTGSYNLFIGYTTIYTSASNVSLNSWTHIAVSRSGTSLRVFLNGSQSGSTITNSTNFGNQKCFIGINVNLTNAITGYLSNVRLVKGSAVYTANFTPSTAPLTAITNTSLLTCQSSSFTDFSSNNFTVTPNGNVSAQFYGPFAGPVPEPAVDVYTTTGVANTWTKRPGAKAVQMIAIGAGGGGGGGGTGTAGTFRNGGSGGGGGANGQIIYTADQLPATLYIRVGASGTAGVSNGAGGAGGNSTISSDVNSDFVYCMGGGGGGGKQGGQSTEGGGGGGGGIAGAGTTGTGASAVAGGLPALGSGDYIAGGGGGGGYSNTTSPGRAEWGGGGGGCARQAGDFRYDGAGSLYGGAGGGCGSALNTGGGVNGGTSGGLSGSYGFSGGGSGGVFNSNGGAGPNASGLYAAGGGGGGGFANGSGTGYLGGAGGFPGGGGGGGGAGSSAGGTGGVGGAGRVVLITFF
jgi:hypothetical protein